MLVTETCTECGKAYGQEEMMNYGNSWICATCKPIFVQKLKEGVNVSSAMNYAGFWIRFAAKFVDGICQQIMGFILGAGIGAVGGAGVGTQVAATLVGLAIGAAYNTYFIGAHGATPGKMACGLKVVMADGESVSYGRAFGRHFAEMLSGIILLIGYIMAAFDPEKRALHDRICNTRVVRK